jgi:predicted metal-dependent HD superfamily phosphohydrolase
MKGYWDELMAEIGETGPRGDALYADILRRYAEPQRHYHTSVHLGHLFQLLEENKGLIQDRAAVIGAIFFHDVIYDPASARNEEDSALFAVRALALLGAPVALCSRIADLVRMTAAHKPAPGDDDAALFLDMDMAILGASADAYNRYAQQVRREFEPHYGAAAYINGRLQKFIEPTLAADRIFVTPVMQARYGEQARKNLEREKQDLVARREGKPAARYQ